MNASGAIGWSQITKLCAAISSVHSLRLITVSSSSFSVGIKALQKGWSQSFFAGAFVRPMTASFCSDSPLICYLFLSSRENKRFLAMINWIVNNFVLFWVLSWDLEAIFWWESFFFLLWAYHSQFSLFSSDLKVIKTTSIPQQTSK